MVVNSCSPHVGGQQGSRDHPKITPCPLCCLATSQSAGRKGLPAAEMQKHIRQRVEYWLFLLPPPLLDARQLLVLTHHVCF